MTTIDKDKFIHGSGMDISKEMADRIETEIKAGESPVAFIGDDGQMYAGYNAVALEVNEAGARVVLMADHMRITEFQLSPGMSWKIEGIVGRLLLERLEVTKPEVSDNAN